jgi:uncharacterized membrane protein YqjE
MKSYTAGIKEKLENIATQTQDIAETGYKLALIEGTEQVTKVVSATIFIYILLLLFNFLLMFLGFGLARWIGDALDDAKLGYFIVGGFYLVVILLVLLLGKKVIVPFFRNTIIKKLYE